MIDKLKGLSVLLSSGKEVLLQEKILVSEGYAICDTSDHNIVAKVFRPGFPEALIEKEVSTIQSPENTFTMPFREQIKVPCEGRELDVLIYNCEGLQNLIAVIGSGHFETILRSNDTSPIYKLLLSTLEALLTFQKQEVEYIHRGLTADSLFYDREYRVKIANFSLASSNTTEESIAELIDSTDRSLRRKERMTPEILNSKKVNSKMDVWDFGLLVYYIYHGSYPPFNSKEDIVPTPLIKFRPNIPPMVREMISLCLKAKPEQRPSFEILSRTIERALSHLMTGKDGLKQPDERQARSAKKAEAVERAKSQAPQATKTNRKIDSGLMYKWTKVIKGLTTQTEGFILSLIEVNESPPPLKYVDFLAMKAWNNRKKISKFIDIIYQKAHSLHQETVSALKVLITLHAYMRLGPVEVFTTEGKNGVSANVIVNYINNNWSTVMNESPAVHKDPARSSASSRLIVGYSDILERKIEFHLKSTDLFLGDFRLITKAVPSEELPIEKLVQLAEGLVGYLDHLVRFAQETVKNQIRLVKIKEVTILMIIGEVSDAVTVLWYLLFLLGYRTHASTPPEDNAMTWIARKALKIIEDLGVYFPIEKLNVEVFKGLQRIGQQKRAFEDLERIAWEKVNLDTSTQLPLLFISIAKLHINPVQPNWFIEKTGKKGKTSRKSSILSCSTGQPAKKDTKTQRKHGDLWQLLEDDEVTYEREDFLKKDNDTPERRLKKGSLEIHTGEPKPSVKLASTEDFLSQRHTVDASLTHLYANRIRGSHFMFESDLSVPSDLFSLKKDNSFQSFLAISPSPTKRKEDLAFGEYIPLYSSRTGGLHSPWFFNTDTDRRSCIVQTLRMPVHEEIKEEPFESPRYHQSPASQTKLQFNPEDYILSNEPEANKEEPLVEFGTVQRQPSKESDHLPRADTQQHFDELIKGYAIASFKMDVDELRADREKELNKSADIHDYLRMESSDVVDSEDNGWNKLVSSNPHIVGQGTTGLDEIISDGNVRSDKPGEELSSIIQFMRNEIPSNVDNMYIDYSQIKMKEMVGEGAFCQVFRGEWMGLNIALKRFNNNALEIENAKELFRELAVLLRLRPHPNMVCLMGISLRDGLPCLVTEFCEGGSLYELLHKKKKIELSWEARISFALDIATGMLYLHSLNPPVLHRDLKSPNILIEHEFDPRRSTKTRLKISDFGLSRLQNPLETEKMSGGVGTCHWMAPEMVENLPYTKKADVYSYGILLWELIMREIPYKDKKNRFAIMQHVVNGGRPEMNKLPSECPTELMELMLVCLEREAERRPSFDAIIPRLVGLQRNYAHKAEI